jgi:hypothetical protein
VVENKAANDFVPVSPTGLPVHNSDSYTRVWQPLMEELVEDGIAPFRIHDLRHTHVAWLIAGGTPLPHIQARLGHESIRTTIDTYGHLPPAGDELISDIVDTVLEGQQIRPPLRLVQADHLGRSGLGSSLLGGDVGQSSIRRSRLCIRL